MSLNPEFAEIPQGIRPGWFVELTAASPVKERLWTLRNRHNTVFGRLNAYKRRRRGYQMARRLPASTKMRLYLRPRLPKPKIGAKA
jgi:hypothetical protein